jgi:membrane protease YdiL (CAAX protease family)
MSATEALRVDPTRDEPVASWQHTVVLTGIFLLLTLGGILSQHRATSQGGALVPQPNVLPIYLSLIAAQVGLFYYVWRVGLRRKGVGLRDLVGGRWSSLEDVLTDVTLALGVWTVWMIIQIAWGHLFASSHAASINSLLPRRPVEIVSWIALSLIAGFSEELTFRGYFQRQFAAFTHSRWIGLGLQALLFGMSHGYQGTQACLKITLYGALFGLLALWRKSLRPGMLAHALTDIVAGIF